MCTTEHRIYAGHKPVGSIKREAEHMIDEICFSESLKKPRMYRKVARGDYLNLAKCKKRTGKRIGKTIKK